MSLLPPNPSKLSKTPPIPSLSPLAHPLMLADLQKYRHKRSQATTSLPTITSIPTTCQPTTSKSNPITPQPLPRGTERYCTWRCKSWKRARFETARECECGFEHEICHPSEWKGTPAEAEWDYWNGWENGGYKERERRVRWKEPVGTVVGVGAGWGKEGEGERVEPRDRKAKKEWEWELVEEDNGEIGGEAVDLGIEMGGVGEDPNEEMEDLFEYFDPTVYRRIDGCTGAGRLDPADSRVDSDTEGGLSNSADRVPRQSYLTRKPKVAKSGARDRLMDIAGREPGRFM